MKEYDSYIPLTYNDGAPVEKSLIGRIGKLLLNQLDGLTFFPQANQGFWRMGDVVFRDRIVVFRVLTTNARAARRFFAKFKEKLKTDLDQEEILIVEKDATRL